MIKAIDQTGELANDIPACYGSYICYSSSNENIQNIILSPTIRILEVLIDT